MNGEEDPNHGYPPEFADDAGDDSADQKYRKEKPDWITPPANTSDAPPASHGDARTHASGINWANLGSFRVWSTAGCGGVLVVLILVIALVLLGFEQTSFLEVVLWIVFGVVTVILVFGQVSDPSNVLYCPSCRKRVKMGATTCHHCGRPVA